ncbi:BREX system P-loop protein BrxC [Thiothrix nivea]|uniref:BREX system P-loop protein BrxC n=1 Tax=Thiothrix nivea (strain ATCC 35100 / DSM 5205 / JP2) TaxID=870187 RepID=A0A656HKG1_THINJ|nr:BREX system P-loop protein BrxC [Thiothrix nivea]EIJ36722.1 hypothetical protein Thini_4235 [Thiothrix nivea DSM 5205]
MNVEHIFNKPLTRDINGVVKAEQLDNASVYVELDEYVVTRELEQHFRHFFETYTPSLTSRSPAMAGKIGVWVSGFFGSGKSHFIKILSYLLENRQTDKDGQQRRAIDFFQEKCDASAIDATLYSDMHSAAHHAADVILFNIDSRANTDEQENAILKVFLKVFNERVGYCADFPHIAHLERELDGRGQYQAFKDKFAGLTGSTWEKERDAFDFYRDELMTSLAAASKQSEPSVRQWVEQLENNFPLDIRNFCKWVNDYIEHNGGRNVLFLVDEVGQFVGKNSQMMLKLQTITEDLGTYCGGRAWVIVTAQADIDAAIGQLDKRQGDDFSKIQGRFYTRLQLSSTNTAEVIQKRLLEKTEPARAQLEALFADKGDILRNQLSFDKTTTAELKSYTDTRSFVDNYPFIPYHYALVQKVFESIRTKGATGKHLAMGERSLLDAFQSAAKQVKDQALDVLIPFHRFYAPIESFLEPAVKRTIDQACELDSLTAFDADILKTLFLIRYVEAVKSTLDNLVTLTVERIDTDKVALRRQIEESLNRLERQLLIARNGDEFIFLTNEEKEIENEIRHTEIESSEQTHKLSQIVFDTLLQRQTAYRYPVNKQDFRVSRFCNGHPRDGANLEDLVVKVVSPLDPAYDSYHLEANCIKHTLANDGCILIRLGENKRLWDELTTFIKTERFLKVASGQRPEQEHLLRDKAFENTQREKRLYTEFTALFTDADVYAIGARLQPKNTTPSTLVDETYRYVLENTFSKLNMLRPTQGDLNRELQAVLTADDVAQLGLDLNVPECNPEAMREIERYVSLKISRNDAVYLKDVLNQFTRRPYGWQENEILLLLARLGLAGKLSFTLQAADLPLKKAYQPFTSVRSRADIRLQKIRQHDERQLQKTAALVKDLFQKPFTGSGEKELAELIRRELSQWHDSLKTFRSKAQTGQYPGKADIDKGIVLVVGLLEQSNSFTLIEQMLQDAAALEDFAEDFEDLDNFYNSQFQTWQTLATALHNQFKDNRQALEKDDTARNAVAELEGIYNSASPYGQLRRISPLIEQVQKINQQLLEEKRPHALNRVAQRINNITAALDAAGAPSELRNRALHPLQQCRQTIEKAVSIPLILSQQTEANTLEDEAYDLINRHIEEKVKQPSPPPPSPGKSGDTPPPPPPKPVTPVKKTITVRAVGSHGETILETEAQVGEYIRQLQESLLKAVRAGDRVRVK